MRASKWLVFVGFAALVPALFSLVLGVPQRASADAAVCDASNCTITDTTIEDFQLGRLNYTGLRKIGDGEVQLLPVGMTSPWLTDSGVLPGKRSEFAAVSYHDVDGRDLIYVIGGMDNSTIPQARSEIFRGVSTSTGPIAAPGWSTLTATPIPVGLMGHSAAISTTSTGGFLYVLGGAYQTDTGSLVATSDIHYKSFNTHGDLVSGAWGSGQLPPVDFPTPLVYHQSLVRGGYLYVIGGTGNPVSGAFDTIYRAAINSDGSLGAWQDAQVLRERKSFGYGLWMTGTGTDWLYLLGGQDAIGDRISAVDYATFNGDGSLAFNTPHTSTVLSRPLWAHSAVQGNRVLYATGGDPGGSETITTAVQSALIDPDGALHSWGVLTSPFITTNPLPHGRKFHSTVINSHGVVYVIGGQDASGFRTDTVFYGSTEASGYGGFYAQEGDFLSRVISLGSSREINRLTVNTTITSTSAATITLKYRVSNTPSFTGAPWKSLASVTAGVGISSTFTVNETGSYLQYQAFLTTSVYPNNNFSPSLNAFQLRYRAPATLTPTATKTPPGGAATPTPSGAYTDFSVSSIVAPAAAGSPMTQTITVYVSNLGNINFNNAPAAAPPVVLQLTGTPRKKPWLLNTLAYTGTNNYFFYVDIYIDRAKPTSPTDTGNCVDISGNASYAWVYSLRQGQSIAVPVKCYLILPKPPATQHTFYAQLDTCDDPTGKNCSTTYGYVLERNESNNIYGPILGGAGVNKYLPLILK